MNQYDFHVRYILKNRYRNIILTFFAKDQKEAEALCNTYIKEASFDHAQIRKITKK